MNTDRNRRAVMAVLENLATKMRRHRALVLTESDLKCQLYLELSQVPEFGAFSATHDAGITGSPLHTETKFFNSLGLLSEAPDLVITDPGRLSIVRRLDGELLPSKGFHFDGAAILIELKFLRSRRAPSRRDIARLEHDIMKGESLNRRPGRIDFHLFVAVYDRFHGGRDSVGQVFRAHRDQHNLTTVYFECE